jgi:hypothetical protein
MKRILLFTVIFFVISAPAFLYSQLKLNVRASASNLLRYGSGKEETISSSTGKDYFEELGDVRLFVNDFIFGIRYEYDDPIEYGTGTKGISRRYVEYNKDNFLVRAGNFYELFGNGLILNAFENRGLGFNTQFDGVKLKYKNNWKNVKFDAAFVGGGMVYDDFLVSGRQEKYSLRGGNFSFSPLKLFSIGGSYLFAKGNIPSGNISTDITAELFEGNFAFNYKSISFQGSYANKKTITVPNSLYPQSKTPRGDGGYASLTFTSGGLGVTADYKNYRFDLVTPSERSSTSPTKVLPFQNPPTCIKEHSSTLLSRYPHTPDFNDEVGFQVDAFYSPIKDEDLTFNFNASLTSRHYDYRDVDTTTLTRYERIDRKDDFLPSPENKYSPYWELYFEGEYYYKNWYFKAGAGRQYSVLYTIVDPANSDIVHAFTVPLEIKYDFAKIYSIDLHAEQQFVYNSVRVGKKKFYNEYLSLSVSRSPSLIVNGTIEFSNDEEDPSGKKVWGTGEITYKISSANSVTLSYGSERGGLKCSSGICRYLNPFNGFRLTVINNFN